VLFRSVYRPPTHIHDLIVKRLERTIYAGCDHLIANTMGNKRFYRELFGIDEKRVTVIPCGYDTNEETLNHSLPRIKRPSDTFILGYMGYFDKDGFPWQEFLLSFKNLIDSRRVDGIEFRICGHMSHQARRFIEKNDLSGHVRHYGVLPHEKAYKLISESDLLVLLLYETSYSKAIVPHKLYYYLAMSKPVLALVEEGGEVEDIMRRTGAGKTVSATKPDAVRQALNEYYDQWKERGQISYSADREMVAGYEYGNLTRTLKEAMDKVLGIDVEIFRVKNEQGSGRKNDKPYLYLHREHQV
jgi:glycosyltransferase involved in cell wall biosynthesis